MDFTYAFFSSFYQLLCVVNSLNHPNYLLIGCWCIGTSKSLCHRRLNPCCQHPSAMDGLLLYSLSLGCAADTSFSAALQHHLPWVLPSRSKVAAPDKIISISLSTYLGFPVLMGLIQWMQPGIILLCVKPCFIRCMFKSKFKSRLPEHRPALTLVWAHGSEFLFSLA